MNKPNKDLKNSFTQVILQALSLIFFTLSILMIFSPKEVSLVAHVGLSGEIRPANRMEQRILEAEKLGFEQIFISSYNKINKNSFAIKIIEYSKVEEVYQALFG